MPPPKLRRRTPRAVLVLSAYPGRAAADRAARRLVKDGVVACATVVPNGRAHYRWDGKQRAEPSALLWAKTTAARARAAVRAVRDGHPDEVPEILVLPVSGGHGPYLAWIAAEVRRGR
jgi:periplasmic divalent cation tolerance protein